MTNNHVKDISKIYLEKIVESSHLETDMEKRAKDNEEAREEIRKTKAHKDMAAAARKKMEEGLDPVGKEDSDIDNDGDVDKSDKYLHKRRKAIGKAITLRKEALDPVGQEDADIDNDGDTDKSDKYLHNRRKAIGKAIAKNRNKSVKEGFSNWRQDLSEVMTDDIAEKPIKEKKIKNKIKVNPTIGEAVEQLGGQLIEMFEISGILDEIDDEELEFISDRMIEESVREIFYDCLNEGYEIEEIEEMICESVDTSLTLLTEAEVTYGHDTENPNKKKRTGILQKIKGAVKTIGKGLARGAGYAAGAAVRGAKAIGRETAAGYQSGRQGSSASSTTSTPTSSSQEDEGGSDEGEKKPGIISRIGSKLKKGLKKAIATGARAVSRGARNVARKMEGGETEKAETPKAAPKKVEKPSDPWEGSATTPPKKEKEEGRPAKKARKGSPSPAEVKAKIDAKEKAKPKAKRKSKLDDLLASVRNESVIGDRARNSVADDRLSSEQEKTNASMDRLRAQTKRHKKSTSLERTQAKIAAKKSEDTARAMHPKPGVRGHRIEETQLDEKTLTKKEMSKREEIVKSMKDKAADFEKRYPGRGKEVMYATATKMAKKIAEQNLDENIFSDIVDKIKGRQVVGRTGSGGKIYMPTKVKQSNVQYQSTPKPAAAKPAPTGSAAVQAVKSDPWTKGAISRDDVMRARADMRAARGTSPKPSKGGSSSLSNASSSQSSVTGKYQVGGSRGYGISGIKLAD